MKHFPFYFSKQINKWVGLSTSGLATKTGAQALVKAVAPNEKPTTIEADDFDQALSKLKEVKP